MGAFYQMLCFIYCFLLPLAVLYLFIYSNKLKNALIYIIHTYTLKT